MAAPADRPAARALGWAIDRAAQLCVAQLVAGTVGLAYLLATDTGAPWPRLGLRYLHAVVYVCVGVLLRFVVRAEERSRTLGLFLMCTGAVFVAGSMRGPESLRHTVMAPLEIVFLIRVDALTPYLAWRFASDFPHVPDSRRGLRLLALARATSLALSLVLVAASLFALRFGDTDGPLAYLSHDGGRSIYFQLQYVLVLAAFAVLVIRARRASLDERRRVSLLVGGIVLGGLPTIVWIILWTVVPGFGGLVPLRYAGWVIYPALLATPVIAAYAIVARRAFGVTLLFRRAVEHAVSRYSMLLLLSAPAIALVLHLYRHRAEPLADTLSLRNGWVALLLLAVTGLGYRSHRALLERIDRAFLRERYDARHITAQLVEDCRWVGTRDELAALLTTGLDRALHVERVRLYLRDERSGVFDAVGGQGPSLPTDAPLVALISAADESLDIDADEPASRTMPPSEITWLTDSRARCLVPLHDARSHLLGFLMLGPKLSQLPFGRDDRALLRSVARAAELTIEYHRLFDATEDPATPESTATMTRECASCGLVVTDLAECCTACTGTLVDCLLPGVVGGNLKLVVRVGGGGMGTVYRALDTDLGRAVALKTLPYVSPDAAARLRREAHIMATLEHDAVASVYAVHSWQGKPIVVYEFMAEGTLADRVARGPLHPEEVVSMGLTIADGLSAIHAAGLLHGDIKPSNIGFTSTGRPKLLDFGIAAPVQTLGTRMEHPSHAGTLAYLAPEIAGGGIPTFDADVWSLAITLFEAVTGRQPMIGADFAETMHRVRAGRVPPASQYRPDVPLELDRFFEAVLTPNGRRPSTAAALRASLARVQAGGAIVT